MSSQIVVLAAESHSEVNQVLSWGVGGGTLALLLLLLAALVAFGGGREHS
jgi:hypothetical protein